jgi:hypothetical protein
MYAPQGAQAAVASPSASVGFVSPSVVVSVSQAAKIARLGAAAGVETYTALDAIAAYQAAVQTNTLADFAPVAIKDSSANVQSVLETLGDLAKSQKITVVSLTDKTASLTIDRSVVSGRLDDASTSDGTISLLQKIGSKYTLQATNASVDDALSIKGPNKQATLSLEIKDTADAVSNKLDALGALIKKKTVTSVYLSDSSATLTMTAAQLKINASNLTAIKSDYSIKLTEASLKDLATANANNKVSDVYLKESAATILKNAAAIRSNQKIVRVEFNDKKELKFSIDQMMTLKSLGTVQQPSAGYVIADKALTIIAHIRYDINDIISGAKTISITDKKPANITLDDARTLNAISNLQKGAKYNLVESISSVSANTSSQDEAARDGAEEVILATSYSVSEINNLLKLKKLKRAVDVAVSDTAANIITEARNSRGALSRGLTVTVRDTAANIAANIDALQALAKDNRITVIELTDNTTPILDLKDQEWEKNPEAIGKISSRFTHLQYMAQLDSLRITKDGKSSFFYDDFGSGNPSGFTPTSNLAGLSPYYNVKEGTSVVEKDDALWFYVANATKTEGVENGYERATIHTTVRTSNGTGASALRAFNDFDVEAIFNYVNPKPGSYYGIRLTDQSEARDTDDTIELSLSKSRSAKL